MLIAFYQQNNALFRPRLAFLHGLYKAGQLSMLYMPNGVLLCLLEKSRLSLRSTKERSVWGMLAYCTYDREQRDNECWRGTSWFYPSRKKVVESHGFGLLWSERTFGFSSAFLVPSSITHDDVDFCIEQKSNTGHRDHAISQTCDKVFDAGWSWLWRSGDVWVLV